MAAYRSFVCVLLAAAVIAAVDATFEVGHLPGGHRRLRGRLSASLSMLKSTALRYAELYRHVSCRYLCKTLLME